MKNRGKIIGLFAIAFVGVSAVWASNLLLNEPVEDVPASAQVSGQFQKTTIDERMEGRTAIGDIDGDGKNDIAVHKWGSSRGSADQAGLYWYRHPNWQKHTVREGPPGGSPEHDFFGDGIVIADINGDGRGDIVTSKGNSNRAEVWLYINGGGSWQEIQLGTIATDSELKDIEVHDMDGDSRLDIIARAKSKTAIFFQNSNGTWDNRTITTESLEGMAIGNIGGSTRADIVFNGFWYENNNTRNLSAWTKHNFDTSWVEVPNSGYPNNAVSVRVADLNKDTKNDIVICHSEKTGKPLNWYQANNPTQGPNGWTKHTIATVDYCHSMDVGDFDGDNDIDIMVIELPRKTNAAAYLFVNNGSQSFNRVKISDGGGYKAAVGDIDNDNDLDIVSATGWASEGFIAKPIYLLRNGGGGGTGPPVLCRLDSWKRHVIDQSRPWRTHFVLSGNIDSDSHPDVVAGGFWYKNPGTPGGNWVRKQIGGDLNNAVLLGDFDGDGKIDILGTQGKDAETNPNLVWARNDGSGNFTHHKNIPAGSGDFIQGAAMSGRNIALSWHARSNGVQMLTIPTNPESTNWVLNTISSVTQEEDLSFGNIDRSGAEDLLLGTKWLRNNGNNWTSFDIANKSDPDRNKLADINGDGRLDAVVGFEAISKLGDIYWYEQPANPTNPWIPHKVATIIGPMSLDVADMDKDGDLDIIVGEHHLDNPSQARTFIFENVDGEGGSWRQYLVNTGDEHHDGTQVVDIDGDGDLDIISVGWQNTRVVLYENTSNCGSQFLPSPSPDQPPPQNSTISGPTPEDPNPAPIEGYTRALRPGSVYREFSVVSNFSGGEEDGTWRVTGSGAPPAGTKFRPNGENPKNYVQISDLESAVSAELILSAWSGHPGSREKRIRINDQWFDLPLPPNLPAETESRYYSQWNPVVDIPVSVLRNGSNEIQGEVCPSCISWPQWGYMSAMVRVYYNEGAKSGVPDVRITSPSSGGTLNHNQMIATQASGAQEIEILGYYNGLDENGDGHFHDWHREYITPRGLTPGDRASGLRNDIMHIKRHIGNGAQVAWDTSLVPNQRGGAISLLARAKSPNGLWKVSQRVDGLNLQRDFSVQMFRVNNLPTSFNGCQSNSSANISIPSDYLTQIDSGILEIRSWAGTYGQRILFNGTNVRDNLVPDSWSLRDYAYSQTYHMLPVGGIRNDNLVKFERDQCANVHGIEVLAPGPVLLLQYGIPSTAPPIGTFPFRPIKVPGWLLAIKQMLGPSRPHSGNVLKSNIVYCDDGTPSTSPETGDERIYTAFGCVPVGNTQAFISFVVERALAVGGGLTFLLLIYASFLYMSSKGDPKKVGAAKELFTAALAGLFVIILSISLLRIFGNEILRLPGL